MLSRPTPKRKIKKKSSLLVQTMHQNKAYQNKISQTTQKNKDSMTPFWFWSFLTLPDVTHKVHHHHLYHISDVLLNITRFFPPFISLNSRTLSVHPLAHPSTCAHWCYLFYKSTIAPNIFIPSLNNIKDELLLNTDAFQHCCRLSV